MLEKHQKPKRFFIVTFDFSKDPLKEKLSGFDLDEIEITSINDPEFIAKLCEFQPEKVFIDGYLPLLSKLQQLLCDCIRYSTLNKFELELISFDNDINFTGVSYVGDFNEMKKALKAKEIMGEKA